MNNFVRKLVCSGYDELGIMSFEVIIIVLVIILDVQKKSYNNVNIYECKTKHNGSSCTQTHVHCIVRSTLKIILVHCCYL